MKKYKIHYEEGCKLGELVYLREAQPIQNKYQKQRAGFFECQFCGKEFTAALFMVKAVKTRSCGCLAIKINTERRTTHGMSKTSEWCTWKGMRRRCYNKNFKEFKNYGALGIKVCDRWLNSFENFYEDMGKKPSKDYSLDRIDPKGDYCKENCRWATRTQQNRNKKSTIYITYIGFRKPLAEWIEIFGLNVDNVRGRLKRGWTEERAFEYKKI